jgi:predicted dehydrogenase
MHDVVHLGLIGAGRWGQVIIRALDRVPGARLTRLATRSTDRPPLLPPDIAGVIIATPPSVHAELATLAIEAGIPVLMEKPMTHTRASAEALVNLVRGVGGILRVNHVDVHNPAWVGLKDHLGEVGPINAVEMAFGGPGPARFCDVPPHWDWGAHAVALAYDLFEAPSSVRARDISPGADDELVRMELGFGRGVAVAITTGNGFLERRRRVAVHGATSTLVYDDTLPAKLARVVSGVEQPLPFPDGDALERSLQAFVDSIRRGEPDWEDAIAGLSVVTTLTTVDQRLAAVRTMP